MIASEKKKIKEYVIPPLQGGRVQVATKGLLSQSRESQHGRHGSLGRGLSQACPLAPERAGASSEAHRAPCGPHGWPPGLRLLPQSLLLSVLSLSGVGTLGGFLGLPTLLSNSQPRPGSPGPSF